MKLDPIFSNLLAGKDLSASESDAVFTALFEEKLSPQKAKSLLLLLARKGESVSELAGCLKALRRLEPVDKHRFLKLMDTCGTGGDGSRSINISTLAALVIAGAGGKVAKHGNRSITSHCGSSDVLAELGVNLKMPKSKILKSIQKTGIGYFHAPEHHPIFSKTLNLRRELKTKTIFNLLGPLANPMKLHSRLVGVASEKIFELYIQLLQRENETALVCCGQSFDEISATQPTRAAWIQNGKVKRFTIRPNHFFKLAAGSVNGGDSKKNAEIALGILKGRIRGRARQTIVLNAAAGLLISNLADSMEDGIQKAEESLDSGKALEALRGLVRYSK